MITDKIRDDEESGAAEADWKFAAMVIFFRITILSIFKNYTLTCLKIKLFLILQVIDRLCLIVFSIFTAAATVGVLLAAPHVIVY